MMATRTTAASAPTRRVDTATTTALNPAARKRRFEPSKRRNRNVNKPEIIAILNPQKQKSMLFSV